MYAGNMTGSYSTVASSDAETLSLFTSSEIVAGVSSILGHPVEKIEPLAYKSQVVSAV